MQIQFNNKPLEVNELCEGIAIRETASGSKYYYILCPVTGEYKFAHQKRWDGLMKKYGSPEAIAKNVVSNAGKSNGNSSESKDKDKPVSSRKPKGKRAKTAVKSNSGEYGKTYWSRNKPGAVIKVEYHEDVTWDEEGGE